MELMKPLTSEPKLTINILGTSIATNIVITCPNNPKTKLSDVFFIVLLDITKPPLNYSNFQMLKIEDYTKAEQ